MTDEPLQYCDHHLDIRDPTASCKPWPKSLRCRRRLHRAFLQWYSASRGRFLIDLEVLKRTDGHIEIGFCKISRVLTATLSSNGLDVVIEWQGTCWDLLRCFDADPEPVPGGYVRGLCPADGRPIFTSRDDLWRSEIFEPFLEWVNDELTKAVAVSIYSTRD